MSATNLSSLPGQFGVNGHWQATANGAYVEPGLGKQATVPCISTA